MPNLFLFNSEASTNPIFLSYPNRILLLFKQDFKFQPVPAQIQSGGIGRLMKIATDRLFTGQIEYIGRCIFYAGRPSFLALDSWRGTAIVVFPELRPLRACDDRCRERRWVGRYRCFRPLSSPLTAGARQRSCAVQLLPHSLDGRRALSRKPRPAS